MIKNIISIVVLVLGLNAQGYAASFDCGKASTDVEKMVCSNQVLSKLDEVMSNNYTAAMEANKKAGYGSEVDLNEKQKQWNKSRSKCKTVECLGDMYAARIDEICNDSILPGVDLKNCIVLNLEPGFLVPKPQAKPEPLPDPEPEEETPVVQADVMPFEVKAGQGGVLITSLDNDLVINKIDFNRGNCRSIDFVKLRYDDRHVPWSVNKPIYSKQGLGMLKYGEEKQYLTTVNCNIREAVISTNRGEWTLTFN